ncbi:alpha/beta hydrolase [Staphylococcus simulans]
MNSRRKKWLTIGAIIFVLLGIAVGVGVKLYMDYQHKQNMKSKVAINNNNVKMFTDITYGESYPNSQLDIITPAELDKDVKLPVIFWMHGGGFIAGDKQYKNPLLSRIAEQGYIVVNVNYALAPHYKYPTPLIQMDQAVKFIKKNPHELPIDFTQVVFGGDSAGAQLSSQYTAIQTDEQLRKDMDFKQRFKTKNIRAAIFFGGFYNMNTVRETEFPRIQLFMKSYTGTENWETEFRDLSEMSTVEHVTKDYPPTFLSVGDADPFFSQNREFAQVLDDQGTSSDTFFFDGSHHLKHQYQFHLDYPESKENLVAVQRFLSRNTSSTTIENPDEQFEPFQLNPYKE